MSKSGEGWLDLVPILSFFCCVSSASSQPISPGRKWCGPFFDQSTTGMKERRERKTTIGSTLTSTLQTLVFVWFLVCERCLIGPFLHPMRNVNIYPFFAMKRRVLEWQRKLNLSHRSFAIEENKNLSFLKRCVIKLNHNRSDYHYQTD